MSESNDPLSIDDQRLLLNLAHASIRFGVERRARVAQVSDPTEAKKSPESPANNGKYRGTHGEDDGGNCGGKREGDCGGAMHIDVMGFAEHLRVTRATFVTLHHLGLLRGCIGRLEATRPLVEDVVDNAYSAAFGDPRFSPVCEAELANLCIEISILSASTPIEFVDENDLVSRVRPGVDGLILTETAGAYPTRGTFLPDVWATEPDPVKFIRLLKTKAGLSEDYWSDTVMVQRYTTERFADAGF